MYMCIHTIRLQNVYDRVEYQGLTGSMSRYYEHTRDCSSCLRLKRNLVVSFRNQAQKHSNEV